VNIRGNGKQEDTERASRSEMIKSCFTVRKNQIVKPGTKNIYLKITGPDGKVLPSKEDNATVKVNGVDEPFSVTREIEYVNEDLDVCVYYTALAELTKGSYKIAVIEGGNVIGTTDLVLK
jgi:hypothetical protein